MSDNEPSTLGDTLTNTVYTEMEVEEASVSMVSDNGKQEQDETINKKKRKSKKKNDGYKSRKRVKPSKQPKQSDEYEVEMIIDHKVDEEVRY